MLGLLAAPATAQREQEDDSRLALRVGTGHTDNVASAPAASAEGASYLLLGVSAALKTERARIRTSLDGDLDYGFYSSDTIENSPMGRLVAGVTLVGGPSVFEWVTTDDFGSVRVDLLRAPSAVNRQYVNVFETGPDLTLSIGRKTALNLGGRYQQRDWQESGQLDGNALSTSVGVVRTLSSVRTIGVTATTRRIEYDVATLEPYDMTSVYARYVGPLTGGDLSLDLGRTELDFAGKTTDGPYVGVTWNRPLSARSSVYVRGSRKLDDAADQFFDGGSALFALGGNAALTSDPRTRTEWGAGYQRGSPRNSVGVDVSMFWDRQATEFALNRDGQWVAVYVNHQMGVDWDIGARFGAGHETLRRPRGTSDQKELGIIASRRFGRPLTLSIEYGLRTWRSDFGASTDENAVIVALVWNAI
jgi:hypothetical protein